MSCPEFELYNPSTGISTFLQKLLAMVEDPRCDKLISWNPDGNSFRVHDPVTFAKEVLPQFFKHSNFSSFVRQLNMYDFHKVLDVQQGALATNQQEWEFANPKFKRGQLELLAQVKRKAGTADSNKAKGESVRRVMASLQAIQEQQAVIRDRLDNMDSDNKALWGEMGRLKSRHQLQQQTINRILYFLTSIYAPDRLSCRDRQYLMLQGDEDPNAMENGHRRGVADADGNTPTLANDQGQTSLFGSGLSLGIGGLMSSPGHNASASGPQRDFFGSTEAHSGQPSASLGGNDIMNNYMPNTEPYSLGMDFNSISNLKSTANPNPSPGTRQQPASTGNHAGYNYGTAPPPGAGGIRHGHY